MASVSSKKGMRSRARRRLDFDEDTDSTTHKFTWPTTTEVEEVKTEMKDTILNRDISKSSDDVTYNKGSKHITRGAVISSAPPSNQQHSVGITNMYMACPNNHCGYGLNGGMMEHSNSEHTASHASAYVPESRQSQCLERRCEMLRKCLNKSMNQTSIELVNQNRTFVIPSERGLDTNTVDKSVPILDIIFPLKKCMRGVNDRKNSQLDHIETETDDIFVDIEMYSNIANKVLTNRVLEGERKSLERTRIMSKTMNSKEQNLKSGKVVEDVLPETVAAFIASEEKGFKSLPEVTYQKLFPEDKSSPTVKVLHTAKNKRTPIIPVSALSPKEGILEYEDASYLEFESPAEFDIPESQPINIGRKPSEILGSSQMEGDQIDICLENIPPIRGNQVQLRGSVPPNWFPGYTYALPKSSDTIRVDQPYHIFEEAWKTLSPTQCSSPEGTIIVGN